MKQEKLISKLEYAGLSDKAAAVYAALIELGGAYPSHIAEITKINRSTVYKILDDLAIQDLVNRLRKGKKFYYQATDPKQLVHFAKDKMRIAKRRHEYAAKLMPELEGLFAVAKHKPRVAYFEGLDEVLDLYADHIDVEEPYEMLAYSNTEGVVKFMPKKFRDEYIKKKEKVGITARGIVPSSEVDLKYNEIAYSHVSKNIHPELRHVPTDIFPYQVEITMYSTNKVSIVNFSEGKFIGVIIEEQDIHDVMKMVFELAWVGAKQYSD